MGSGPVAEQGSGVEQRFQNYSTFSCIKPKPALSSRRWQTCRPNSLGRLSWVAWNNKRETCECSWSGDLIFFTPNGR